PGVRPGRNPRRSTSTAGGSVSFSPLSVLLGSVNLSRAASPIWLAERSFTATATGGVGAVGSPGAPQPVQAGQSRPSQAKRAAARSAARVFMNAGRRSQDVAAQILILHDVDQLLVDVGRIDLHRLFLEIRRFEGKLVEYLLENGVQPAGPDVFRLLVYAGREL